MTALRDVLMALAILAGAASCGVAGRDPAASVVGAGVFVSDSGQAIRADYRDNGTVTLTFTDGATRILSQARSASGAPYVSGSSEWWEHHGEATYSLDGTQVFRGRLEAKPGG